MNYGARLKQIDSLHKQITECESKIKLQTEKKKDLEEKLNDLENETCLDFLKSNNLKITDIAQRFGISLTDKPKSVKPDTAGSDTDEEVEEI